MTDYTKAQYTSTNPADMILGTYTGSFTVGARPGALGTKTGVIQTIASNVNLAINYSTPFTTMIFSTNNSTWYPEQNEIGLVNGLNTVGTVMAAPMTLIGTTSPVYIYATNGTTSQVTVYYKLAVFASAVNDTVTGIV